MLDRLAIASVVLNGFGSPMSELPGSPAEKRRDIRRHRLRKIAFIVAVGSVVVGIALQLLDLFRA
ncbi:MAG TPA: hypothetical protein VFX20_13980 [Steroidobacteraceae bacterium]|nr:hypothetical protein [Steroidobacteraceae bacterium]